MKPEKWHEQNKKYSTAIFAVFNKPIWSDINMYDGGRITLGPLKWASLKGKLNRMLAFYCFISSITILFVEKKENGVEIEWMENMRRPNQL